MRSPVFCVLATLAIASALVACGGDDEPPPPEEAALEVPEGAVAFVDEVEEGEVTQEEFDAAISLNAGLGGEKMPAEGSRGYDLLTTTALQEVLLKRWVAGELEEREITVTEADIDAELESVIDTQFSSRDDYAKFLQDSGLTEEDARARVEIQASSRALQDDVTAKTDDPEEEESVMAEFQKEFEAKWRERTICSEDLLPDPGKFAEEELATRCSNFEPPE
ncbi:MAG: hypothetical protein QOI31_162 [Solirubrobacterales bacterium]|jgi:hypothetical protein|nr:hypothetical protein [Solirubrobacterales bacterium]